jgi:AMP nucleosidase
VSEVTGLSGFELKRIMRTGTVASVDNRNWELGDHVAVPRKLSQSRAIALDMESATIAANGFRFRVPYETLLCVSDKPLHGGSSLRAWPASSTANAFHSTWRSVSGRWRSSKPGSKLRSLAEVAFQ